MRSIPYLHPSVAVRRMALTPVELAEAALIALHYWANDSESARQASFKQKALSADAIKTWTSDDGGVGYEDHMNYNASLLFFLLIEPHRMGSNVPSVSHIVFPKWAKQDRTQVLTNWGSEYQKSGVGQDNYRCNIIEWLLCHLGQHASERGAMAAHLLLQTGWKAMREWTDEHNQNYALSRPDTLNLVIMQSGRVVPLALAEHAGGASVAMSSSMSVATGSSDMSVDTGSSSSNYIPAAKLVSAAESRKIIPTDFPYEFSQAFKTLLKDGKVWEWYDTQRDEFTQWGCYYIRQALPGSNSNKANKLYQVVINQFNAWDKSEV